MTFDEALAQLDKQKLDAVAFMPKDIDNTFLAKIEHRNFPKGTSYSDEDELRRLFHSGKYDAMLVYKANRKKGEVKCNAEVISNDKWIDDFHVIVTGGKPDASLVSALKDKAQKRKSMMRNLADKQMGVDHRIAEEKAMSIAKRLGARWIQQGAVTRVVLPNSVIKNAKVKIVKRNGSWWCICPDGNLRGEADNADGAVKWAEANGYKDWKVVNTEARKIIDNAIGTNVDDNILVGICAVKNSEGNVEITYTVPGFTKEKTVKYIAPISTIQSFLKANGLSAESKNIITELVRSGKYTARWPQCVVFKIACL